MDSRLKNRLAQHLTELLQVEAQERLGPIEELYGAQVSLVSPLLIQVWIPQVSEPRRLIEIKVSEPVL